MAVWSKFVDVGFIVFDCFGRAVGEVCAEAVVDGCAYLFAYSNIPSLVKKTHLSWPRKLYTAFAGFVVTG